MVGALQRIACVNAAPVCQGLPLESLRALGGKEFQGVRGGDPTCAEYWLEGVVCILGQMGCFDEDKVRCVRSLLLDEGHRWWMTVKRGTVCERVAWDFFLESFQMKFMREQYLEAKRREFMDLVQGTLSLDEYEAELVHLSQYAPDLVAHKVSCCKRFRFGLNCEIKLHLVAQSVEVFDKLVENAYALEETLGEEPKTISVGAVKRMSESFSGSNQKGKRGRFRRSGWRGAIGRTPASARERGHGRSDSGRGVALVDSGATRSFILSDVVRKLGILVETYRLRFTVKSPLGDSVAVDWVYRCCPLMVQRMDWLTRHRLKVDCEVKMVTLCCLDGSKVVVREKFKLLSNVISLLRAEKLVQKGYKAYLTYVLNVDSKELRLDKIRAACDFLNMFPEGLPSLPPNREVEFDIELYLDIASVSITLYHMAPKELKELKLQL
ncbi:uncharacterized protein LOC105771848 [Gossypium raimondii]|uniref:uncharacterized protein LOC105771848 n=1 Tax=Gossypium raimondii TaxID=29730 RepID=UPI00063AF16B|nr:uncharacterized protein LOC105771848 [Gossypium raimondii]